MDILTAFQGVLPESVLTWMVVATAVSSALAVTLPAPKSGGSKVYRAAYGLVQWIALNIGRAKNAQDVKPKSDV